MARESSRGTKRRGEEIRAENKQDAEKEIRFSRARSRADRKGKGARGRASRRIINCGRRTAEGGREGGGKGEGQRQNERARSLKLIIYLTIKETAVRMDAHRGEARYMRASGRMRNVRGPGANVFGRWNSGRGRRRRGEGEADERDTLFFQSSRANIKTSARNIFQSMGIYRR